jgi:hypothetical protein
MRERHDPAKTMVKCCEELGAKNMYRVNSLVAQTYKRVSHKNVHDYLKHVCLSS